MWDKQQPKADNCKIGTQIEQADPHSVHWLSLLDLSVGCPIGEHAVRRSWGARTTPVEALASVAACTSIRFTRTGAGASVTACSSLQPTSITVTNKSDSNAGQLHESV